MVVWGQSEVRSMLVASQRGLNVESGCSSPTDWYSWARS